MLSLVGYPEGRYPFAPISAGRKFETHRIEPEAAWPARPRHPCSPHTGRMGNKQAHGHASHADRPRGPRRVVEWVTFHSSEAGFCILRVKARGHRARTTTIGHAATIPPKNGLRPPVTGSMAAWTVSSSQCASSPAGCFLSGWPSGSRIIGWKAWQQPVESRCGAVAVGRTYLLPPLSSGGASLVQPWLRLHTPRIEPDMQISASGSRTKHHAFTHATSCPSRLRRTSPKCP
jgi:hypothetical protein